MLMQRRAALVVLLLVSSARADEGLWTLDQPPTATIAERYGFRPTRELLDRLQRSAVRFNSGGSGAFVSKTGLVLTNHHVGADCIHKLGQKDHDYVKEGFLARRLPDELRCPDLELNVLEEIVDVSSELRPLEQQGLDEAALLRAQRAQIAAIEKRCLESLPKARRTQTRCEVVTLYSGAAFARHRYRRYTDVRLVFAPEFQIAFYGGDPDNFEYPRFDLDVALFRVYEQGRPLRPLAWLPWSRTGAVDGELVFVVGNPGRTERLLTLSQLETLRDVVYPALLSSIARMRALIERYAARGSEEARQVARLRFDYDNSWKAVSGYAAGLRDPALMERKRADEQALLQVLSPTSEVGGKSPIAAIAAAQERYRKIFPRHFLLEGRMGDVMCSELFWIARTVLRFTDERARPSGERLAEFRDSNLPSLEVSLFSPAPIHKALEEEILANALGRLRDEWGASDPTMVAALAGKTPEARAHEVVAGTRLGEVEVRRQLWKDPERVRQSQDPMLVLLRALDGEGRRLRRTYEDEVEAVIKRQATQLGRARFLLRKSGAYPDATWTLRLSYGRVAGYRDGERAIPWTTDLAGLYARAAEKAEQSPWDLPERWRQRRGRLDLSTPFNFISTADIIGGSSGSPVVNRRGELVGVVFDGNLDMLPNNFAYRDERARTVSVHVAAIVEALRAVYDAAPLAAELAGR